MSVLLDVRWNLIYPSGKGNGKLAEMDVVALSKDKPVILFTGTAGVLPAMSAKREKALISWSKAGVCRPSSRPRVASKVWTKYGGL